MRLRTKIIYTLMITVLLNVVGAVFINIKQTQKLVMTQLKENARNTAFTLSLALQEQLMKNDIKSMDLLARAIFDSGEYQSIKITRSDGSIVSAYQIKKISIQSVPEWFIRMVNLKVPQESIDLMKGWSRFGKVAIEVSPAFTYISLWNSIKKTVILALIVNIAIILFILVMLKILLRPMMRTIDNMKQLILGKYTKQERIPHTIEFRDLVLTTNQIGKRLSYLYQRMTDINQKLQKNLFFVPNTSLANEKYLDMRLSYLVSMKKEYIYGTITYLQLSDIDSDEAIQLYDDFNNSDLWNYASFISQYKNGIVIILPFEGSERSTKTIDNLLKEHPVLDANKSYSSILINGYWQHETAQDIYNAIDDLVEKSTHGKSIVQWQLANGQSNIEEIIINSLNNKSIEVYPHSVKSTANDDKVLFVDAYYQISVGNDKLISKSSFSKIAEKHDMAEAFDRLMINKILDHRQQQKNIDVMTSYMISRQSLRSNHFLEYLEKRLNCPKEVTEKLCLVINESDLLRNLEQAERLSEILKKRKAKLALNDVGRNTIELTHLKKFPLAYLKINGSLTVGIDKTEEIQQFVAELNFICSTLNIPTIAVEVSQQEEVSLLKKLGVSGYSPLKNS